VQRGQGTSLFHGLKPTYESSVYVILEDKREPPIQYQPFLVQHPFAIPHIKDEKAISARIKGGKVVPLQRCHEIVGKYRVFTDCVNAHFVEGLILKIDAITASEHLRILRAL